jgi:hypothetical protein
MGEGIKMQVQFRLTSFAELSRRISHLLLKNAFPLPPDRYYMTCLPPLSNLNDLENKQ